MNRESFEAVLRGTEAMGQVGVVILQQAFRSLRSDRDLLAGHAQDIRAVIENERRRSATPMMRVAHGPQP